MDIHTHANVKQILLPWRSRGITYWIYLMKKYSLGFGIFYLILSIILNFIAGKLNLRNGVFSLVVVFLLTTTASCIFPLGGSPRKKIAAQHLKKKYHSHGRVFYAFG